MTTWSLSPQYKKSAVEKMFFFKDGKIITIEQGFRWATFKMESDTCPMSTAELKNDDGYQLDGDWEMWDMVDGCWIDIESHCDATDEEVEEFTNAWDEDSFEGVEALGWSQDECEYYYHGPLVLTNESTGEEFKGEPDEVPEVPANLTSEEKVQIIEELEAEVRAEQAQGAKWPFSPPAPEVEEVEGFTDLTDWFHKDHYYPTMPGRYQVTSYDSANWPFPSFAIWDGKKWSENVISWRGLAKDPTQ